MIIISYIYSYLFEILRIKFQIGWYISFNSGLVLNYVNLSHFSSIWGFRVGLRSMVCFFKTTIWWIFEAELGFVNFSFSFVFLFTKIWGFDLQKAEVASKEKNRASAVALNAEIRRTKARLLEEVPKLQRLAMKRVDNHYSYFSQYFLICIALCTGIGLELLLNTPLGFVPSFIWFSSRLVNSGLLVYSYSRYKSLSSIHCACSLLFVIGHTVTFLWSRLETPSSSCFFYQSEIAV